MVPASYAFQSLLLVKDVPARLPANMSSTEPGWALYRCDQPLTEAPTAARDDPCTLVSMSKVQRHYELRQTAYGWRRQVIAGWRLAARVVDDRLEDKGDVVWRFGAPEFLVVEVGSPARARRPAHLRAHRPASFDAGRQHSQAAACREHVCKGSLSRPIACARRGRHGRVALREATSAPCSRGSALPHPALAHIAAHTSPGSAG